MTLFYQDFSECSIAFINSFRDIPRIENYLYLGDRQTNHNLIHFKNVEISKKIIIVLPGLNWLDNIHIFVNNGFKKFAILPSLNTNNSRRTCIVSYEKKIIFLPNYKVMYSSFREYMRKTFPEFRDAPKVSHGLNSTINLDDRKFKDFFKFSIVRNPFDRYASFYRDKLARHPEHYNYNVWNKPICSILGKNQLTLQESLDFINQIPDSHSDPHFLSQQSKLYCNGKPLVDYIGKIECLTDSLQHIASKTQIPSIDVSVHNKTKSNKQDYMSFYASDTKSIEIIRQRYKLDFDCFNY